MTRDLDLLLADILDASRAVVACADGLDQAGFMLLPRLPDLRYRALKNALTEIGEGVKLLPKEFRDRNPEIGWRGLTGLRDIVAHQYFRIDMERLWPVVSEEIPNMITALERMIADLPSRDEETPPARPGC